MSKLTIGLTGGIASGKTLIANAFIALGVPVLDADQVARDVVAPGQPALAAIVQAFGPEFLLADGTLDRRRLRERAFGDPAALKALGDITHPAIRASMRQWRQAQTTPYCILSIPLLVESGQTTTVDRVLVIDVPEALQLSRLIARDDVDEALARQMIAAQATRDDRRAAADDVIANDGSPEDARNAVQAMHRRYLELWAQAG